MVMVLIVLKPAKGVVIFSLIEGRCLVCDTGWSQFCICFDIFVYVLIYLHLFVFYKLLDVILSNQLQIYRLSQLHPLFLNFRSWEAGLSERED